jgi:methionyl-tRNA synthetase
MFRLSAFREALLEHFTRNKRSVFPEQYRLDVIGMLESDQPGGAPVLEDISISRPRSRLSWGVPVPGDDQLGGQTVYVWFDALLIYLTGAGYPWGPSSTNTASIRTCAWPPNVQVIGKDILRFHAIYLPAILMALSAPHYATLTGGGTVQPKIHDVPQATIPLAHTLLTHAHWTSDGQKMSKSIGNVVDPIAVMEEWGADVVRFYLIRVGGRWASDVGEVFLRSFVVIYCF